MLEISSDTFLINSMIEFGRYVNSSRHIPKIENGMKPVYDKIMQAGLLLGPKLIKKIVFSGEVLKYHVHGEASLMDPISILVKLGLLVGQGNHGQEQLMMSVPPAAARYTEVSCNPIIHKIINQIIPFVPTFINDLGNKEYKYFPFPIPFCTFSEVIGIGYGAGVHTPRFKPMSVWNAYINNNPRLLEAPEGYELINDYESQLVSLWTEGTGNLTYKLKVDEFNYNGRWAFSIELPKDAEAVVFKPDLSKLLELESQGLLNVMDMTSETENKIIIQRAKRINKITDDEIRHLVEESSIQSIPYYIKAFDDTTTFPISMYNFIKNVYKRWEKLVKKYRKTKLDSIQDELNMWNCLPKAKDIIIEKLTGKRSDIPDEIHPKSLDLSIKVLLDESIWKKNIDKLNKEHEEIEKNVTPENYAQDIINSLS